MPSPNVKTGAERHPEKRRNPDRPQPRRPEWLRVKAPRNVAFTETTRLMRELDLVTVCEEAACPNIGECWSQKHATMMILGSVCTRACAFCNVATGRPDLLDPHEPEHVGQAVARLGLRHVVITSVDRDDLDDGGAIHFAQTITAIRASSPDTTIEILTPDFLKKDNAIDIIVEAKPDVFNHNLETVPRLYKYARPGADYSHSLKLLKSVKNLMPKVFTKSGIMVGLGENDDEILEVIKDLDKNAIDLLTIGQYLSPSIGHLPVKRFVTPKQFNDYRSFAQNLNFKNVASGPLVRSSYHAEKQSLNIFKK